MKLNMRNLAIPLTIAAVLLLLAVCAIAINPTVSAQANEVTATVNLNYLTIQVLSIISRIGCGPQTRVPDPRRR